MTLKEVNINITLAKLKQQLKDEKDVSPALRATIERVLVIVTLLAQRLGLNSRNSSQPPSSDPHRPRQEKKPGDMIPAALALRGDAGKKRADKTDT